MLPHAFPRLFLEKVFVQILDLWTTAGSFDLQPLPYLRSFCQKDDHLEKIGNRLSSPLNYYDSLHYNQSLEFNQQLFLLWLIVIIKFFWCVSISLVTTNSTWGATGTERHSAATANMFQLAQLKGLCLFSTRRPAQLSKNSGSTGIWFVTQTFKGWLTLELFGILQLSGDCRSLASEWLRFS